MIRGLNMYVYTINKDQIYYILLFFYFYIITQTKGEISQRDTFLLF